MARGTRHRMIFNHPLDRSQQVAGDHRLLNRRPDAPCFREMFLGIACHEDTRNMPSVQFRYQRGHIVVAEVHVQDCAIDLHLKDQLARVRHVVDRANDDSLELLKHLREIERDQCLVLHDQNAITG